MVKKHKKSEKIDIYIYLHIAWILCLQSLKDAELQTNKIIATACLAESTKIKKFLRLNEKCKTDPICL